MADGSEIAEHVSGAAQQLAEVFNKVVSVYVEPATIRKNAEAKAQAIEIVSQAKLVAEQKELAQRAMLGQLQTQMYRHANLENILARSQEMLSGVSTLEGPIDEEWIHRFIEAAQYSNKPDIQEIWAKILAQEAIKPGTTTYRTMQTLNQLDPQEAQLFERINNILIDGEYIYKVNQEGTFPEINIEYKDILRLIAAGLIQPNDNLNLTLELNSTNNTFDLAGMNFLISHPSETKFVINDYKLTPSGKEIAHVVNKTPNMEYFKLLREKLALTGWVVSDPIR